MTEDRTSLARARTLLDLRRYTEAVELLGTVLARSPQDFDATVLLSRALLGSGQAKDALEQAERACVIDPHAGEPHRLRAEALRSLRRPRKAAAAARRAIELAPEDAGAHWELALASIPQRDWHTATREADEVARLEAGRSFAHHARGFVLLRRKQYAAAEQEYQHALAAAPNEPTYLNNLGSALLGQGRTQEAMDLFTRAGQVDPSKSLYVANTARAAQRHAWSGWSRHVTALLNRNRGVRVVFVLGALLLAPQYPIVGVALVPVIFIAFVRQRRLPETARIAIRANTSRRRSQQRITWQSGTFKETPIREWFRGGLGGWRLALAVTVTLVLGYFIVMLIIGFIIMAVS